MRVLIACEFSGVVRRAFRARGHEAYSCDLLPAEDGNRDWIQSHPHHIQGDAVKVAYFTEHWQNTGKGWDLMIGHPPCTDLAVSGSRWFPEKIADGRQQAALAFVSALMDAPIERIAIENPISIISTRIRKPDQIIQPWQFGHGEVKATCFWLKNLPPLCPTHVDDGDLFSKEAPLERDPRVWRLPPGPDRWKERSRTLTGIAEAMADQWGSLG